MNNKDEKTFADLFSNSEKEDLKKQSFDNIFDNNQQVDITSESEVKDTKNSSITFDSIYDNIVQENKEEEVNFDLFSEAAKETNAEKEEKAFVNDDLEVESNSSSEVFQKENKEESNGEINPFMSISFEEKEEKNGKEELEQENPSSLSTIFSDSATKKIEKNDDEVVTLEEKLNDNPFFFDNTDSLTSDSTIEKEVKIEDSTSVFDSLNNKAEIETQFSNPFFTENSEERVDSPKELGESNNVVEKSQDDNLINPNPFFDSEINGNNPSVEKALVQDDVAVENVLETNSLTSNPFFATEKNSEGSINSVTKEEKEVLPQKDEKVLNKEEVKSSSPFFQEENTNLAENPFFQNQLNLVENKQVDTPVGTINTDKVKHYNVKVEKKKEPLLKFIIGVFSYALFIFLLLIGITLLIYVLDIKIRAAKGDYTAPTFNAYVVLTGSMLPDIEVYDVVVTKKIDAKDLKEKDIITFASDDSRFRGTIITHRIIKKNPPSADNKGYTFQTKGDNNNVADSALVPEANIYGKVILKIPKLGYLQEFLASDGGWIIVILIPCLVVISYDIVKLAKGLKRKKYKNIKVQK